MRVPAVDPPRRLDLLAVQRCLRRAASAPGAPWLHGEVARRLAERLPLIRLQPQRIVDWSSFTGGGAAALAAAYPQAERIAVEPDAVLLQRSRDALRSPWWSARRWRAPVQVVDEAAPLPDAVQLVWSNMLLHAVADPPALFARWHEALAIDGFVMFSCLGPGTVPELRRLYRAQGWGVPTQGFVDLHDLGDMLVHAGFADPVMDQETLTLRWPSPEALLAELRTLGSNAAPERFGGLRTPRWRERLVAALQETAAADGRLQLAFEVVYGHAFKGAPRARTGEPTAVSLADMRSLVRAARKAG